MEYKKNILCIGAGYVGGITMSFIASKCPQYKITIVDINEEKIKSWQSDKLPIYEPGLNEIIKIAIGRNLFFSTNIEKEIQEADIIFVSVNTPTKDYGQGKGKAADLQYWEKTARQILLYSDHEKIIVEKSTVPVKTSLAMERILNSNSLGIHFEVLSNPEFLSEGSAIKDLEEPDRILIGSKETEEGLKARKEIVNIYTNWVPKEKIIESNVWSAELSKLSANAFLAQRISSINSLSALCEKTGADIEEVSFAIGKDSRIGSKFLNSSVGFGGSCFKKDILNLVYICQNYGLTEVANYWESVVKINEWQKNRFISNIILNMFNTIAGKKITILGFSFKANTGDTRESPSIYITKKLLEEKAFVTISDPKALDNAKRDFNNIQGITYEIDPYKATYESHAILILTEWDLYKNLDYNRIFKNMKKPSFIFDGRNILNHKELFILGFNVFSIGKKTLTHF